MIKKIRVYASEKKTLDGQNTFIKWSYTKDGETFFEVKFTKKCAIPQEKGYYLLEADSKDINIKKTKEKTYTDDNGVVTTVKPNNILWFKAIKSITRDEVYEAELEAKREAEVNELL